MSLSLRDQLVKAGLASQKQAEQAKRQKKKQQRLVNKGLAEADQSTQQAAARAAQEKALRDQQLNQQQQEKAQRKALSAQIRQLIDGSKLPRLETDDYYNFVDQKKVKRIAVNDLVRDKLSRGSLAIVSHGGGYEIVPKAAAEKIQERDPRRIVLLNELSGEPDADDPYAQYQVPDDLMW